MKSVNKVLIMGYLAQDPEYKSSTTGSNRALFSVATNHEWVDAAGEKKQITDFHKVVAWRKLGEIAAKHLKKGAGIYLEGHLINRSIKNKEGESKFVTEIVADSLNFLSYKKNKTAEELNLVEVPVEA